MLRGRLLAGAVALVSGSALAQGPPDRLLLRAEDPTARAVTFVVAGRRGGELQVLADSLATRGDTITVHVNPAAPAVVLLPDRALAAELRAVPGGPALYADLVSRDDPTRRRRVRAAGPVLLVARDSAGGFVRLGAAAR